MGHHTPHDSTFRHRHPTNPQTTPSPKYHVILVIRVCPPRSSLSILPQLTLPNHSRLGSEIFELTAAGGRKSYFVHKNLLMAQSVLLRTTVDAATTERKLDLQAWDGDTVQHLANFLYLHTYGTWKPEPLSPAVYLSEGTASDANNTESRVPTPDTTCSDGTIQPESTLDPNDPRPLTPLSALRDSNYNDGIYCGSTHVEDERQYSVDFPQETHNYKNTLLAHAKVYALAQSLAIDTLCGMAYHRLLVILENFNPIAPGSHLALNIVELLHYVYDNTQGTGDKMRRLVSQFVALNFTAVQCTKEMKDLVGNDGQLAVAVMGKVCRRLVASEDELAQITTNLAHVKEKLGVEQQAVAGLKVRNDGAEKALQDMTMARDKLQQSLSDTMIKLGGAEKSLREAVAKAKAKANSKTMMF